MTESNTKITVSCPNGHRLRGGPLLVGKEVKCPKCQSEFVFAPTGGHHHRTPVSDTTVMRILGDAPAPTQPEPESNIKTRPCIHCASLVPETAAVCNHCNSYVGVLPTFMQQMVNGEPAGHSN